MTRITITDEDGMNCGWFDNDSAVKFAETKYFNGSNMISKATGSQWSHEALYLTAKGRWIMNEWSNYQGSEETYRTIAAETAARWLIANDGDVEAIAETLNPDMRKRFLDCVAGSEV